jgi:hypothetical protein
MGADSEGRGGMSTPEGQDDAFDLGADDGEEVYEWVGDDDAGSDRDRRPRVSVREALTRLRTARPGIRRRAVTALATAALVAGAAVGGTAWFDAVARGADEAAVVNVALDAVIDGDPALAEIDTHTAKGSVQYVLEVANNGPDAVTMVDFEIDAGSMMTSTGWQPVGSPRIPPGGTGKAAVTVDLDCGILLFGQAVSSGSLGSGFSFPDVALSVRTGDDTVRTVTLTSRQHVPGDARVRAIDGQSPAEAPQITMTDLSSCDTALSAQARERQKDSAAALDSTPAPTPNPTPATPAPGTQVTIAYTGVKQAATQASQDYVLGFRAHNTAGTEITMATSNNGSTYTGLVTTMAPESATIAPGGYADFTVSVQITTCHDGLGEDSVTQLSVSTTPYKGSASTTNPFAPQSGQQFGPLSHFLTGSNVQIALDELAQRKAACP